MIQDIKERIAKNTVTIGTDSTLKGLRQGKLDTVVITQNCPEDIITLIETLHAETKIVKIDQKNDELGIICKKPFSISVLGFLK